MERTAVASSTIASVGYDAASRLLEIVFLTGLVYQYLRVPARVHTALLHAASKGKYFNRYIRNAYSYRRVK